MDYESRKCFSCNQPDHVASQCSTIQCYKCRGSRHLARDCGEIVFPGDTRGIPEVGIVAFPDVEGVASLGISPEIVALPAADITFPRRAAEVEMEALTETIGDQNIVARDCLGRGNSPGKEGAIVPYRREGNMPYRREGGVLGKK